MNRALIAAVFYFLVLFTLGFALGTIRVLFIAPLIGSLSATLMEVLLMLSAAYFICRWAIRRWEVPLTLSARGVMAVCFLVLLALFETLVGIALFRRTLTGTWSGLATQHGLIGLLAQSTAALLPLVVGTKGERRRA